MIELPLAGARRRPAALLSGAIALLGWGALAIDLCIALRRAPAPGHGVALAVLDWARFFTIQSNVGLAVLMSAVALALARHRPLPPAAVFRAALVYMAVTGITYELLLRGTWSPRGLRFFTDLAFHDLLPGLFLVFWIAFAPKRGLGWRDLPWLLAYPAAYLAATLAAGAAGAGYPYGFLDPGRLGTAGLAAVAAAFLLVFLALGALATLAGRIGAPGRRSAAPPVRDGRSAAACRRS